MSIAVYEVTFYKTDKDGNPVTDDQGNVIKYVNIGAETGDFSWNDVILPSLDDDNHTYIKESHRDQAWEIEVSRQESQPIEYISCGTHHPEYDAYCDHKYGGNACTTKGGAK